MRNFITLAHSYNGRLRFAEVRDNQLHFNINDPASDYILELHNDFPRDPDELKSIMDLVQQYISINHFMWDTCDISVYKVEQETDQFRVTKTHI